MIAHSPTYKSIVQSPVMTPRVKFYLRDNVANTNTPIFEGNEVSISVSAIGKFLNSGAEKITAKVTGNQVAYVGQLVKVDLQVTLDRSSGAWETMTLGYFVAYQIEYDIDADTSTITLYDQMYMLSLAPYDLDDNNFPCTVAELANIVAGRAGVDLDPDFDSLPNSDHVITANLWATIQNTSLRSVVDEIAQATGTTAVVSGQTMFFKTFETVSEGLSESDLTKFAIGQKWGNVNSVSLSRQPQNDNILLRDEPDAATNGVFEIVIINNQIMDNDRDTMITPIYDALVTATPFINYYNAELTIAGGYGWYEVGDVIIANLGGNDYKIVVTEVSLQIDGGIKEVIKSVIPTDPSVNPTTAGGILKTLYNTEIKVDKQNNTITSIVEQQDIYQNYVNENFSLIEQQIDNINLSVQDGGGVNQIKNSVGYSLDNNDNLNFWEYIS